MARRRIPNLIIDDAQLIFPNFSGKERRYNEEGRRNFCVVIDPDQVEALKEEGWYVKKLMPRDETEEPLYYINVNVNFNSNFPPSITMQTGRNRVQLTEDMVGILDFARIIKAGMTIHPREREPGKIKGYLQSMLVVIEEDPYDMRFRSDEEILPF